MEHKQTDAIITAADEDKGQVEAIWAVMGNVDEVGDIIHPGAFTKTFSERGNQVKLLDNHRTDSVLSALGTVLELRELRKGELPQGLMSNPDVTGGAWGKFQFLMDTPEGKGAFTRIQKGAIQSWSFGYDAVDKDFSNKDGRTVRNLRQIKLYEVSPVLFPANTATATTSAKAAPSESKPYRAVRDGDTWEVYKLDAEGQPTGESLGSHDSEAAANEQVRALYANEDGKAAKAGRVFSARNAARIQAAMDMLHEALKEAGLIEEDYDEMMNDEYSSGPPKAADTSTLEVSDLQPETAEAGAPSDDPGTRLRLIELELEELEV